MSQAESTIYETHGAKMSGYCTMPDYGKSALKRAQESKNALTQGSS